MISRHSSVLRPRVLVSTPSASHSGASGLPMPKAGSRRPSESTSIVAHCLASNTGFAERQRHDVHAEPHASRASCQSRHRGHRFKERLTAHDSVSLPYRIYAACLTHVDPAPVRGRARKWKLRTAQSDSDTHWQSFLPPLGRSGCFNPRRHVAHEALETAVHLLWPHTGRHCPGDEVGDAILTHKGCQFLHAMLNGTHHPCLRDAGLTRVTRNAACGALVLVEAAIDLAAVALGGAYSRPIALGVVGHQAGADDPDAIAVGVTARRPQRRAPRIEHH